jgi:hypothetical protein
MEFIARCTRVYDAVKKIHNDLRPPRRVLRAIAHVAIDRSARPLPAIRIKHAGARRLSSDYRIVLTGRRIDSGEQYVYRGGPCVLDRKSSSLAIRDAFSASVLLQGD